MESGSKPVNSRPSYHGLIPGRASDTVLVCVPFILLERLSSKYIPPQMRESWTVIKTVDAPIIGEKKKERGRWYARYRHEWTKSGVVSRWTLLTVPVQHFVVQNQAYNAQETFLLSVAANPVTVTRLYRILIENLARVGRHRWPRNWRITPGHLTRDRYTLKCCEFPASRCLGSGPPDFTVRNCVGNRARDLVRRLYFTVVSENYAIYN